MHLIQLTKILALVALANGAPLAARKLLGTRFARPVDSGQKFLDGRPLFGPSKTVRGVLASIVITTLCAPLIGLEMSIGATAAAAAMAGDLLSSFLKRRLNFPPSSQAIGLDQLPESLFPMLACRDALSLTPADIILGLAIFFAGELILSRILYSVHLRDTPY
ncbi:MAG: CDP-archaeol synthase [Bradyrhizobium sp.]|nr:CDP-archaeol synthase [Bradyrhizobium sp.]